MAVVRATAIEDEDDGRGGKGGKGWIKEIQITHFRAFIRPQPQFFHRSIIEYATLMARFPAPLVRSPFRAAT